MDVNAALSYILSEPLFFMTLLGLIAITITLGWVIRVQLDVIRQIRENRDDFQDIAEETVAFADPLIDELADAWGVEREGKRKRKPKDETYYDPREDAEYVPGVGLPLPDYSDPDVWRDHLKRLDRLERVRRWSDGPRYIITYHDKTK